MKYTSKVIDKQKRLTLIYAENLIFREFDTFFILFTNYIRMFETEP